MPSHVKAAAPKIKGSIAFKASNQRPVASGSAGKRKRPAPPSDDEAEGEGEDAEDDEGDEDDDSMDEADVESEADTDDELAAAQSGKSKKTAKRKRRATSPSTFGAALVGLLGGDEETKEEENSSKIGAPQQQKAGQSTILSLAPHIRRSAQSSRLNEKASRIAIEAKKRRADRARVTDVIGGWGPPGQAPKTVDGFEKSDDVDEEGAGGALDLEAESNEVKEWRLQGGAQGYEKRLRKVAQRGVVKLFNAIRAAQNTTESDIEQAPVTNGKGGNKKTSSKPANSNVLKSENALGSKGRAVSELSKNNFLDLIRSGSKTAAR